jgi:hypothetical protein
VSLERLNALLDAVRGNRFQRERLSCIARVLRAAGLGPGDRVALAYSFGPYIQLWACHAGVLDRRRRGRRCHLTPSA